MKRLNKKELIDYLRDKYGFIEVDDKVIIYRNFYDMLWGTMMIERQPESGKIIVYGVPKKNNGCKSLSKFFTVEKKQKTVER